ncbi:hypothetical protein EVAR_24590_1 [Eumeta japonica]|uniref:Uncharacterized protein n=1 Tax=Eumeta variegata TaxID=151549 RepID=A0A4C1W5A3_EUMVA|nr:hypothetical protein EVAR_24590_1 [Eumeta japonica]
MSITLEKMDTPTLNKLPNDIESTNGIDNVIDALTSHITTVVRNSLRKVPVNSDHQKLPADVCKLLRAKNATLRCVSAYTTPVNRSHARVFQRKVRARVWKVHNDNWSALIEEITPTHKDYW